MDGVERGPDGVLQWVRRVSDKPHQRRATIVNERYFQPRNYAEFVSDRSTPDGQIRRHPPSFSEIERLLEIYVATGEGQGSFLAAKVWEETKGPYYRNIESEIRQRYHSPPRNRPSTNSSSSSSDGDFRPGGEPTPHTGPSGGPKKPLWPASGPAVTKTSIPSVPQPTRHYDEEILHTTGRRAANASRIRIDRRVWTSIREPDFAGAVYVNELGPQSIYPPRAAHVRAERHVTRREERIVDPVVNDPAAPTGGRYQARVDDASEEEDVRQPFYADLPPHEDDVRANSQTRRRRSSGSRMTKRTVMMRGGGLDYDPEETQSNGNSPSFFHLRGGGPRAQPPTRTSSIWPDPDRTDIEPREIE